MTLMDIVSTIKKNALVARIWERIRLYRILGSQKRIASICDEEISDYLEGKLTRFRYARKKELSSDKIIWQYWESGGSDIPELVSICMDSVARNAGDYQVICLNDGNLEDFIDLPDFLRTRSIDKTHFTDIVRFALLSAYGGVWLDATVFMSGGLPEELKAYPFFMYQRDPDAMHKEYWANTWAYYFGWHEEFKVTVLSSILAAKKENETTPIICDLLLNFWKDHAVLPDYFYLQILIHQLLRRKVIEPIPLKNDCIPHLLQQEVNVGFPFMSPEEILRTTTVHKLTYKFPGATERLKSIADKV